jgi:P4 family phage/plasmid primase-like protien
MRKQGCHPKGSVTAVSFNSNPTLDAALGYLRAGLSVLPIKRDGSKAPAVQAWKKYQQHRPTEAEAREWFDRADPPGIAVLGGAVSEGLECIDFDVQAEAVYPQWCELVEAETPGLLTRLCVVRTPRPGFHVRCRCTETPIPGNTKLAVDPTLPADQRCLIETRGQGGYALAPGCPTKCHETGKLYEHIAGLALADVQAITAAERETLLRCARSFNREVRETPPATAKNGADLRPGDEFNRCGPDWSEILAGWTLATQHPDGKRYWRRPGKDGKGWSATTGACSSKDGVELFACFSENAGPFQGAHDGRPCTCYSKFAAYTLLNHNGDFKSAAKDLAHQGYGSRSATNGHIKAPCSHDGMDEGCPPASASVPEIHLTDDGNARRVVKRHGRDLRFCHPWRTWLIWDGRRWAEDQTAEGMQRVKETRDSLYQWVANRIKELGAAGDDDERKAQLVKLNKLLNHLLRWEDARRIAASLELAKSEPGVPVLPSQLDHDPMLLNVLNGTIDLRTGRLREHKREDMLTKLAPVEYDPDATCSFWQACLDRWMGSNTRMIRYLQRVVGYSLTGDVSEQALWFFYGQGANGKSTFLGLVLRMLGDYAMQAVSDLLMQKHNESHPTERADLFGKRFIATIETEEGKRLAEALMKQVTSGDRIRARKLYKDFFEFDPTHKIILAANHKPAVRGTDRAVWRRIKLVPFTVTISDAEKDKAMPEKLAAELPGVLAWAVAGCLEWQRYGLQEPEEVRAATAAYRAEQDTMAGFISECCRVHTDAKVRSSALFDAYQKWSGEKLTTAPAFRARMNDKGYRSERGTGGHWYYHGVGLLASDDQGDGR